MAPGDLVDLARTELADVFELSPRVPVVAREFPRAVEDGVPHALPVAAQEVHLVHRVPELGVHARGGGPCGVVEGLGIRLEGLPQGKGLARLSRHPGVLGYVVFYNAQGELAPGRRRLLQPLGERGRPLRLWPLHRARRRARLGVSLGPGRGQGAHLFGRRQGQGRCLHSSLGRFGSYWHLADFAQARPEFFIREFDGFLRRPPEDPQRPANAAEEEVARSPVEDLLAHFPGGEGFALLLRRSRALQGYRRRRLHERAHQPWSRPLDDWDASRQGRNARLERRGDRRSSRGGKRHPAHFPADLEGFLGRSLLLGLLHNPPHVPLGLELFGQEWLGQRAYWMSEEAPGEELRHTGEEAGGKR